MEIFEDKTSKQVKSRCQKEKKKLKTEHLLANMVNRLVLDKSVIPLKCVSNYVLFSQNELLSFNNQL